MRNHYLDHVTTVTKKQLKMSKSERIKFWGLLGIILLVYSLNCQGKNTTSIISVAEYPLYFSADAWEEIKRVNTNSLNAEGKIVAIMDTPTKYLAGLQGKQANDIQREIDKGAQYFTY